MGKQGHLKILSCQEDNVIKIIVQDNGLGFHISILEKSKSIGLRNLTKRLELMVDGTVTINSILGKGTEVIVEMIGKHRDMSRGHKCTYRKQINGEV